MILRDTTPRHLRVRLSALAPRPILFQLVAAIYLGVVYPCSADDQQNRFLEFPNDYETVTFDLSTVQIITPGRFAIIQSSIDNADFMKFELKVLETLGKYCARPEGVYSAPPDLVSWGPADMQIKPIEVQSTDKKNFDASTPNKVVYWYYPYKRLAFDTTDGPFERSPSFPVLCKGNKKDDKSYFYSYNQITNGTKYKVLYDCKRGLEGMFFDQQDETPHTSFVHKDTVGFGYYFVVCSVVTHEPPYVPE
jgi:hypothetical protein